MNSAALGMSVLSVLARCDDVITDVGALLRRGRESYLTAWPQDTKNAAVRVDNLEQDWNQPCPSWR